MMDKGPYGTALAELKHSIMTHLVIMGGPSQQLCAFLVKTIDFIEDSDDRRRSDEIMLLAYSIAEAIAVRIVQSIEAKVSKAERDIKNIPDQVWSSVNAILNKIDETRQMQDKCSAKALLLETVGHELDALGWLIGVYPTIYNDKGQKLNNRQSPEASLISPLTTDTASERG